MAAKGTRRRRTFYNFRNDDPAGAPRPASGHRGQKSRRMGSRHIGFGRWSAASIDRIRFFCTKRARNDVASFRATDGACRYRDEPTWRCGTTMAVYSPIVGPASCRARSGTGVGVFSGRQRVGCCTAGDKQRTHWADSNRSPKQRNGNCGRGICGSRPGRSAGCG